MNVLVLTYWSSKESVTYGKWEKDFFAGKLGSNRIRNIALKHSDINSINAINSKEYSKEGILHLEQKRFLVLVYNSFADPLFQNLILAYIKTQSERHPNYSFDLLTFEQKEYALTSENLLKTKIALSRERINWHPLTYHSGRFLLLKKLYDFVLAAKEIFLIRIKGKPVYIISFANVAASIGIVLSKIFRTKHLVYSYEPHADFLVDFGIWKKSGMRYKIMSKLERYAGMNSDVILTGTAAMKEELENQHSKAQIYRAPSGVDEDVFSRDEIARSEIRTELKIEHRKVMIYAGKFGGIYYDKEIVAFFKGLLQLDKTYFFLIMSPSDHVHIKSLFKAYNISDSDFYVGYARSAREVSRWNSAADFGLNAIPPLPHQKFRSPVKVGEYLLCGLPYITCKGVSEDAEYALKYGIGAALDDLSEKSAQNAHDQLSEIFKINPSELILKCRKIGEEYRGKSNVDRILDKVLAE